MGQHLCTSARTKKGEISNSRTDLVPKQRRASSSNGLRTARQSTDGGSVTARSIDKHSCSPACRRESNHRRAKSLSRDDSVWTREYPTLRSVENSTGDLNSDHKVACGLSQSCKQDGGFVNTVVDHDLDLIRRPARDVSENDSVRKSVEWNEAWKADLADQTSRNRPPLFRCESEPNTPQRPPKVPNHVSHRIPSRPDMSWLRSSGRRKSRRSSTTSPPQSRWSRCSGSAVEHVISRAEKVDPIANTRTQKYVSQDKHASGNNSERTSTMLEDVDLNKILNGGIEYENLLKLSTGDQLINQSKDLEERSRDGTDRLIEMTKQLLIDLLSDYNSLIFSQLYDAGLTSSELCLSLARSESRQSTCRILIDSMTRQPHRNCNKTDLFQNGKTVNSCRPTSCNSGQSSFDSPKIDRRSCRNKHSDTPIDPLRSYRKDKLLRQESVDASDVDVGAISSTDKTNNCATFKRKSLSQLDSREKSVAEECGFALIRAVICNLQLQSNVSKGIIETLDTVDHLLKIANTFRKLSSNCGQTSIQQCTTDTNLTKEIRPRGSFAFSSQNSFAGTKNYKPPSLVNDVISEESDDVSSSRGEVEIKSPAFCVELIPARDANTSSFSERYDCSTLSPALQRQSRLLVGDSEPTKEVSATHPYSVVSDLNNHSTKLHEQEITARTRPGKSEECHSTNCSCERPNINIADERDIGKPSKVSQRASYSPFQIREKKNSKTDDAFRRWSVNCDYSDLKADDNNLPIRLECDNVPSTQKRPSLAQRTFSKSCESELLLEESNGDISSATNNTKTSTAADKDDFKRHVECIKCGNTIKSDHCVESNQSTQSNGEIKDLQLSENRKNSLQRKTGSLLRNLGATFDFSSHGKSKKTQNPTEITPNPTPRHRRSLFRINRPKSSPCLETDNSSFEKYLDSVGNAFRETAQSSKANCRDRLYLCDFCKISTPYYKSLLFAARGCDTHTQNNMDAQSFPEFISYSDVTHESKSLSNCSQNQSEYVRLFKSNGLSGDSLEVKSNRDSVVENLQSLKFSSASSDVLSQFVDVDDTQDDGAQHSALKKHYSAPIRVDRATKFQKPQTRNRSQSRFEPPIFSVSLSNCRSNDFLLEQIGYALQRYRLIRRVSIMLTEGIGVVAMDSICKALERKSDGLIQLDIRLIRLTENVEVMRRLVEGLIKATCLKELNLSSVGLTRDSHQILHAITVGCGTRTLCDLDLAFNELSDEGCESLCESLTGSSSLATIRRLQLRNNGITARGAGLLAQVLRRNSKLVFLDISSNALGDDGVRQLFKSLLSNRTLTDLELDDCGLTSEGCRHVSRALASNTCLRRLSFSKNPLGDQGASSLAEGLRYNRTLQVLAVNLCGIGNSGFYRLLSECAACHSLCTIKACYNSIGEPRSNFVRAQHRRWSSISTVTSTATTNESYRRVRPNRLSWTVGVQEVEAGGLAPEEITIEQDEPNLVELYSKLCEVLRNNPKLKILLWGNKLDGFISKPNRQSIAVPNSRSTVDTVKDAKTARNAADAEIGVIGSQKIIDSSTRIIDTMMPITETASTTYTSKDTYIHADTSGKNQRGFVASTKRVSCKINEAERDLIDADHKSEVNALISLRIDNPAKVGSDSVIVGNSFEKCYGSENSSMRTKRISTGCMINKPDSIGAAQRRISMDVTKTFTESHFHYSTGQTKLANNFDTLNTEDVNSKQQNGHVISKPAVGNIHNPAVGDANNPAIDEAKFLTGSTNKPSISNLNNPVFSNANKSAVNNANTPANGNINKLAIVKANVISNDLVIQCDHEELFTAGAPAVRKESICLQESDEDVPESNFKVKKHETIDSGYGTSYND